MRGEDSDPIAFSIIANFTGGVLLILFALTKGFSPAHITEFLPNLLLMAILYGSSNIFIFKSIKLIEASEFTIFFTTRVLWSIVAAIIVLREVFVPQQFMGTFLIILGIVIVSLKANTLKLGKGELFVLFAAATFGSEFINDAYILQKVDVFFYMPMVFIVPSILTWVVFPRSTKTIIRLTTSPSIKKILLLGVFFAISASTYLIAYQVGRNAAQIASINQSQTVITVVAATIFLKERKDYLKKIIASVLTFAGVLLVK